MSPSPASPIESPSPAMNYKMARGRSSADRSARAFSFRHTRLVHGRVRKPNSTAGARLAGDRARRVDIDPRADRQRQDADGVSVVPRPADVLAAAAETRALPRAVR